MTRRAVVALLGGAALAPPLGARARERVLRVGMATIVPRTAPSIAAFVDRMAELGYRDGVDFALEHVPVAGIDDYARAFRALAAQHVDIMVAFGNEIAASAARDAAEGRPIVLLALSFDPVEKGFAASLAHPGGNITGLFSRQLELAAKRVELIHEALPARRLGLLFDAASRGQAIAGMAAAERLHVEAVLVEVTGQRPDYAAALDRFSGALVIGESPLFVRDNAALGRLLLERGIPAIGAAREDAAAGALLSYGVNVGDALRAAADYVDRIAKGAAPGDIPIEQPKTFELLVNLKAAKALGIEVSPSVFARADEVIE